MLTRMEVLTAIADAVRAFEGQNAQVDQATADRPEDLIVTGISVGDRIVVENGEFDEYTNKSFTTVTIGKEYTTEYKESDGSFVFDKMARNLISYCNEQKRHRAARAFNSDVKARIANSLIARGYNVDLTDNVLRVDGVSVEYQLSIHTDSIRVGGYGRRNSTRYPRHKDGQFAWQKIASDLTAYVRRSKTAAVLDSNLKTNKAVVEELRGTLNVPEYYGPIRFTASTHEGAPVAVRIEWGGVMTVETAVKFHQKFKELMEIAKTV